MINLDPHSTCNRPWTEDEIKTLLSFRGKISYTEIGAKLGRSTAAVTQRVQILKLPPLPKGNRFWSPGRRGGGPCKLWTKEDDETLKNLRGQTTLEEIAKKLARTRNAVATRCTTLKLPPLPLEVQLRLRKKTPWSPAEIDQLRQLRAEGKKASQIALILNRPRNSIISKCKELGIPTPLPQGVPPWTPDEDAKLRVLRADGMEAKVIARLLGRKEQAVEKRCSRLGIPPNKTPTPQPQPKPPRRRPQQPGSTRTIWCKPMVIQGGVSTRTVIWCTFAILCALGIQIALDVYSPPVNILPGLPERYRNSIPTDDIQQPWREPTPFPGNVNRV